MYLLRNVCFFCDSNGLAVMRQCFENCDPDKLPFALAHAMIAIVANVSQIIVEFKIRYVPIKEVIFTKLAVCEKKVTQK